jgi:hypothetical protein
MKLITTNQQVMKKGFFLLIFLFLLNGCAESVALLGSSVGGASSGKMLQSSLNSAISYGIKQQTGKTPLGHVLAYADEKNPEKKQETCISFIEKTRSEFCSVVNRKIALTGNVIREKTLEVVKKYPKNIETKDLASKEGTIFSSGLTQEKKSPRQLAIDLQAKIKNQ